MMGRREEIQRKFGFEVEGGGRGRWAASSSNLVIEQVLNEKERRQSVRPAWRACREFIRAPPRPHQHGPPAPGAIAAAILQPVPSPLPSPRRSRVGARVWLAATDLCAPRKGEQRATIFLSTCGFSFVSVPLSLPSPASSIKRASLDPGRGGRAGHGHERGAHCDGDGARMK